MNGAGFTALPPGQLVASDNLLAAVGNPDLHAGGIAGELIGTGGSPGELASIQVWGQADLIEAEKAHHSGKLSGRAPHDFSPFGPAAIEFVAARHIETEKSPAENAV